MPAIDFPNNPENNQTLVVNNITYRYNSAQWQPPVSYPADGHKYEWNEPTVSWQLRDV